MFQLTQEYPNDVGFSLIAQTQESDATNYRFRGYAIKYWCRHLVDLEDIPETLCSLLMVLLEDRRIDLTRWLEEGRSAWLIAASHNRPGLVQIFLQTQNIGHTANSMIAESLVTAAIHGGIQVLDSLFRCYSPDLNAKYHGQHRTLLHYAAQHNQVDVIDFLFGLQVQLEGNAVVIDPEVEDIKRKTAMDLAACDRHLAVVERLCKYHKRYARFSYRMRKALSVAAAEDQVEIIEKLLGYGDFPIGKVFLKLAGCDLINPAVIEMMVVPFMFNGGSSNDIGEALTSAIGIDNEEHFKCLWPLYEENYKQDHVEPLLIRAMRFKAFAIIELLLEIGNLDLRSIDQWCIRNKNATPNENDNPTLLHLAAETNHLAVVTALLATDWIDPSSKDWRGKTALDIARKHRCKAIVKVLKAHAEKKSIDLAGR